VVAGTLPLCQDALPGLRIALAARFLWATAGVAVRTEKAGAMRLSERTGWPDGFGNWSRWAEPGGTVNLVTPEAVMRGVLAVRAGRPYNCAHELSQENYAYDGDAERAQLRHRPVRCRRSGLD
jgi:hypothetical protein